MVNIPVCSSPKGPLYCTDKNCPARGSDGNHIVMVQSEDLNKGLQDRLAKRQPPARPSSPAPTAMPARTQNVSEQQTLFDMEDDWIGGNLNFYSLAMGVESAFYAEPNEEPIIAKLEGGRKRDIYIVVKGSLRIEYGKHIIRTTSKLLSIGINTDKKLERALAKGLIKITQQPKFEAVDIRYMGRKDESRTPIGISSTNLATVIFETVRYINQP